MKFLRYPALIALPDIGYAEGRTTLMEYRRADRGFERVREISAELVALNVDVIVTTTGELICVLKTSRHRERG